jgi:hypothetical protein
LYGLGGFRCRLRRRSFAFRCKRGHILPRLADDGHCGQHGHIIILGKEHFQQRARFLCLFFKGGFVGFVREQNVPYRHRVPFLFVPLGNDATFYRLPLPRQYHRTCHVCASLLFVCN